MGKLLESQVVRDCFNRLAGNDPSVGLGKPDLPHPVGNGHSVILGEPPLQGAERNVAEAGEFAWAVIGFSGQDFPVVRPRDLYSIIHGNKRLLLLCQGDNDISG